MPSIIIGTASGQAPTAIIDSLYCRDSIAESEVIRLHQKSIECDSLLTTATDIINNKNLIIESYKLELKTSNEVAAKAVRGKRRTIFGGVFLLFTTFLAFVL